MEIPDFLLEMSKQMNEQDNRITADPIWMVFYDKELVTEQGYSESFRAVYDEDGNKICDNSDLVILAEYIEENHEDWFNEWLEYSDITDLEETHEAFADNYNEILDGLPNDLKWFSIQKEMTVVKACLTEADANYFIQRKQHDYPKLYTYVFSMVFCPQMIQLRQWILSLSNKE